MPARMDFTITEDKSRLEILFHDVAPDEKETPKLTLAAADIETLIRLLGACRAEMLPPRPATDPKPGTPMITSQDMRWAVASWRQSPHQLSLCIFDRGIGWVSIGINRAEALRLYRGLEAQIETLSLIQ